MPYKTVSDESLRRGGFSKPASAASFYPDNSPKTHIHLGVPTSAGGAIAPTGSRFVTFISLKVNDKFAGRLDPDAKGNYSLGEIPATSWQPGWKDQLRACLGPMIQL
jgi:hypothetical protein